MAKMYRTEREARADFALECVRWAGIKEGSAEHQALISFYNLIDPLPRGYRMKIKDAWCAAFLCAVAWKKGYRSWNSECSVPRLVEMAKADGIWRSKAHVPEVGDWVVYDLKPDGKGDHIGVVTGVENGKPTFCEGNFSDSVKNRFNVAPDDKIILGYIVNDYMEQVDNSELVGSDRPNIPIEIPEIEEETDMKIYNKVEEMPEWAQEAVQELIDDGTIEGVGGGDLGMTLADIRLAVWLWRRTGGKSKK